MLELLLYKALFELSQDRIEFASRLFSRPRPAGLSADPSPEVLFRAFEAMRPSKTQFDANFRLVMITWARPTDSSSPPKMRTAFDMSRGNEAALMSAEPPRGV